MTDFELVMLTKDGNKNAEVILYKRYLPLIHKKYLIIKKSKKHTDFEEEDFLQDAYLWFIKAIKYVKPERITDPVSWKFIGAYMWYLSSQVSDIFKKESRISTYSIDKEVCFSQLSYCGFNQDESSSFQETLVDNRSPSAFDIAYQKDVISRFKRSLSSVEAIRLNALCRPLSRYGKITLKQAGEEVGITGEGMRNEILRLSKKFRLAAK